MAVDPVKGSVVNPQSLTQYTYVLNNPLIYIDPLGLRGELVLDGEVNYGIYRIGIPVEPDWSYWRTDGFVFDPNAVHTQADIDSWNMYGRLHLLATIFSGASPSSHLQEAMIWGANTFTNLDVEMAESRKGVDLSDALRLYAHYRSGKGTDMKINLKKAYDEDTNIKAFIDAEIANLQKAVENIYFQKMDCENQDRVRFQVIGGLRGMTTHFGSYSATENWHKTLGDFLIYLTADVTYDPKTNRAIAIITVNSLDYYNFNEGATDIMAGLPDDANARFVELGWAKPFITRGRFQTTMRWDF
jgi:hypothetical protein